MAPVKHEIKKHLWKIFGPPRVHGIEAEMPIKLIRKKYDFPFNTMPFFGANADLNDALSKAADRLSQKLVPVASKLSDLGMSSYSQRYMNTVFGNRYRRRYNLTKYSHILSKALEPYDTTELYKVTLVDYGGGHGVLSLLAKELGVGTVIHSDVFATSSNDAQRLAHAISAPSGHFWVGDTDDFRDKMRIFALTADVIVNYDVIEHIYCFRTYFKDLAAVTKEGGRWYMASGANLYNDRLREHLLERHDELEGSLETESEDSYIYKRKKMIASDFPNLLPSEVNTLALATRGWRAEDIQRAIQIYLSSGHVVQYCPPMNNTSDPRNGNWGENMVPIETFTEHPLLRSLAKDIEIEASASWGAFISPDEDKIAQAYASEKMDVKEALKTAPYYCLKVQL